MLAKRAAVTAERDRKQQYKIDRLIGPKAEAALSRKIGSEVARQTLRSQELHGKARAAETDERAAKQLEWRDDFAAAGSAKIAEADQQRAAFQALMDKAAARSKAAAAARRESLQLGAALQESLSVAAGLGEVRDPTTWTILQNYGPNHLGIWYMCSLHIKWP